MLLQIVFNTVRNEMKMKVIYEDNHIIVVEKMVNIPSQSDKTGDKDMLTYIKEYLKEKYRFEYAGSLYSMKPILKSTEIDDSRPTVIRTFSMNPTFISVLSGKINTVYDLDEVLKNE